MDSAMLSQAYHTCRDFLSAGTDSVLPALPMYLSKFTGEWACPMGCTCILPQGFQHSQQYPRHPLKAVEMAVWRAVEVDHRRPTLRGMSAGGGEEPSKMSSCVRLACPYCDRVQTQFPQAKPARSQKRVGATCRSALNFIRF